MPRGDPAGSARFSAIRPPGALGGVQIHEQTRVTGINVKSGVVSGVVTEAGTIRAEYVVNCAGLWAREVGRLAGVSVPLQAAEHYYLISEPIAEVHPLLPILRDPGNSAYIREEAGKIMVGLFEPVARPWGQGGIPDDFCFGDIPPDWDRMYPHIDKAMRRVPKLLDTGIKLLFCGPESFTPDHNYLMGELLASQLYYYIVTNVIKSGDYKFQSFTNNKAVGDYLKAKIFMPANRYYWNDMIEKATGEKLTARYYAKQFVK